MTEDAENIIRLSLDEVMTLAKGALAKAGCNNANAAAIANTVWMAELKSNSRRIIIKVLRKQDLLENELAHLKNHKEGLQALKSADFIEM